MSEQRCDLLVQQCRAIEAACCCGYRAVQANFTIRYVAKVIGNAADEIARLCARLAAAEATNNEIATQLASTREAMEDILKHMESDGMQNWPVAKRVRKFLA